MLERRSGAPEYPNSSTTFTNTLVLPDFFLPTNDITGTGTLRMKDATRDSQAHASVIPPAC